MKKLLLPFALILFGLLTGGASVTTMATAGTLYPGGSYDLSPSLTKIKNPGEICTAPGKAPKGKRIVILQVWAHPGATSVRINGATARQPAYFEQGPRQGFVTSQGWVVKQVVSKSQTRFSVSAQGYAKTASGARSNWTYNKTISFSGYWGSSPLQWNSSFGSNPGVCNFM